MAVLYSWSGESMFWRRLPDVALFIMYIGIPAGMVRLLFYTRAGVAAGDALGCGGLLADADRYRGDAGLSDDFGLGRLDSQITSNTASKLMSGASRS